MELNFRLADIEVSKATMDEKIVGIFRYDGETKGKKTPVLVILAEIASTLYVYEQLLDVINAAAEQARHLTAGFEGDPMARFEKLIQRINDAIASFLEKEPTPVAWNKVSIYVVELSDKHLCISGLGRLSNLFLQKQTDGSSKAFDLFGSLDQPAEVDQRKVFASLVCGDIAAGDVLFAGTQNFERLRGELQMSERLSSQPPVSAALAIKQDLERLDIPDDFAGLVVACINLPGIIAPSKAEGPAEDAKEKSTASVEKMYQTEQEAQAMLSPIIAPVPHPAKRFNGQVQRILAAASEKFAGLKTLFKKRQRGEGARDPLIMASLRGLSAGHGSFMTAKRKLILILGVAVAILVIGGTLWYNHAKKSAAEQALWNTVLDQVTDRKNRAEADLVYGNEDEARRLLQEADKMLAAMDQKTADRVTAKRQMQKDLDDLRNKLKRELRIEHPLEMYSLANAPDNSLRSLSLFKNSLYTADASGGSLVGIKIDTKVSKRYALTQAANILAATAGTNSPLWLAGRELVAMDMKTGSATSVTWGDKRASSTQDIIIYNKRLYALDPAGNMIWKYAATGDGYGQEAAYLKQTNNNLADAVALTIDSNVYVGLKTGKVVRYLSGVEEVWSPTAIEPAMTSLDGLWTSADTDRLVVADQAGKRVVVFRKDGRLIAQIVSPDFQGPRAVTGDVAGKKLYILDGNRVFQVDLP